MLTRLEGWTRFKDLGVWRLQWRSVSRAPTYWLTGAAFVLAYVVVDRLTLVYQLDGLGIKLWDPAAGISLALLVLRGLTFTPFVFAASLAADLPAYSGSRGAIVPLATSLVSTAGLWLLAFVLRKASGFGSDRPRLGDVVALLVIVPVGAFLMAIPYCAIIYASGLLTPWRFVLAVRNFWIGHTLGMVTVAAAAPALVDLVTQRRMQVTHSQVVHIAGFVVTLLAAVWIIFAVPSTHEYQFFYFLFLPIIWIAIRAGYGSASIALLLTHMLLVAIATRLGYGVYDFIAFQMLMLVLSVTGLLLGAIVSERWASDERLRSQQAELARATRQATVGAMGTALAHEISQPMSSATNYLHAARRLMRSQYGDAGGAVAEALEKAEQEARRAREALERVRDYVSSGRVESGGVDLAALAGRIAPLMQRDTGTLEIEVYCARPLPAVRGDAIQLEQLLVNLIANAVDAACLRPDSKGRVAIKLERNTDRVIVAVSDNGPGIAPEIESRLFEPFETTKPRGMGLGLVLARQIVENHGGGLRWERVEPEGTCFSVELPVDGPRRNAS